MKFEKTIAININEETIIHSAAIYISYFISLTILAYVSKLVQSGLAIFLFMTIGIYALAFIREKIEHCLERIITAMV